MPTMNILLPLLYFLFLFNMRAVAAAPVCSMPPQLASEGYQAAGDKYYRLHNSSAELADHHVATQTCNKVGGRLASLKTQEEFDIAAKFAGT